MRHLALSAVGRDRPGIVAAVTGVLLAHGVNVEDSQMGILRGHFTMTLIVAAPDDADVAALRAGLEGVRDELGLEALSLSEVAETDPASEPAPTHIVSVYGVDHPGIVHAVTRALAAREVTITDLETRLVGDEVAAPIYAMMLEIAPPAGADLDALEAELLAIAAEQGIELALRQLDRDAL